MLGFGRGKQLVGVDIGSSSVKAVELKRAGKGLEVSKLCMESLDPEIVVDGAIVDTNAVSNSIAKIFAENKIKTRDVATSVSGHSVIVKKLSLEQMDDKQLEEAIQMEAAQHIPFDIAEVNLDYQILEADPESSVMEVLLVAVKKDKILNYTNVLTMAGKTPVVVDIDAFALQNVYEYNYDPASDATVALLNLGGSVMNINIVRGRTPLFTRDVSVGGNQYTDSLQKELDLGFEDAEQVKMGGSVAGISDEARIPVLQSVSEIIVLEMQKTFDFFRATAGGEHLQKLYIAGGSAKVYGLVDLLKQEFSIPVEELNPFRQIGYDEAGPMGEFVSQNAPRLAVAVGLALRSFENL
ncbi:MAG: type IV pilus assembly protein PilM [Acidobacteria bacterium]|nr:type IV pilus assembly protein PilM [Acidobacteriota bacterium]